MLQNKSIAYLLISPVLGLISALSNLKSKRARIALFGFCLIFGYCFSVGTKRTEFSPDGITMRIEFEKNSSLTGKQYAQYLSDYFAFDTGAQDIYIVSIAFLVGRFTDNYHFFFLTLAIIFAFFQIKCLGYLVRQKKYTNSLACIIIVCLFLWNNIYNINGARFWTASWIGLYCIFKIFYDRKLIYFLLSCSIFLIHAAFVLFPVFILISFCIRFRQRILLSVFCLSFAISFVSTSINFDLLGSYLPLVVAKKLEYYTDGETINRMSSGTGFFWVALLFKMLVNFYLNMLIFLIIKNASVIRDERQRRVVLFMIVLAIISNVGMIIPTFGGRFSVVNYALISYSFLTVFGDRKYVMLIYAMPFVWFMKLFYLCKDVLYVQDFWFLLSPVISAARFLIL